MIKKKFNVNRSDQPHAPTPNLRLRVAYGGLRYEISVNSIATFGEVKKVLTAEIGLQANEQRLIFRGKERENGEYLDRCGVKDRSKVILMQDPSSIERRFIEMRRNAKIQSAHRAISDVSMEIDKLTEQVSAIEKSITDGVKVPEVQITTLIEMLMRQAIKLDGISADGDATAQKNLQGKRVQKSVEALDVLKISNGKIKPAVVTTKWETFDPPPNMSPWELFD
ncbi:BAG family molecular chaperone regulator like [Quillaja saponaria]|uniref:BAG family molecular chaperone regulator like n=1 Tax=Quillaja saponaria TaxID=32244 RepID=A0AAD7PVL9_QUISA|nr:BAG family molecular chaperone regulator like [Quillaja saponaria]